jgi:hypothetical protein
MDMSGYGGKHMEVKFLGQRPAAVFEEKITMASSFTELQDTGFDRVQPHTNIIICFHIHVIIR